MIDYETFLDGLNNSNHGLSYNCRAVRSGYARVCALIMRQEMKHFPLTLDHDETAHSRKKILSYSEHY